MSSPAVQVALHRPLSSGARIRVELVRAPALLAVGLTIESADWFQPLERTGRRTGEPVCRPARRLGAVGPPMWHQARRLHRASNSGCLLNGYRKSSGGRLLQRKERRPADRSRQAPLEKGERPAGRPSRTERSRMERCWPPACAIGSARVGRWRWRCKRQRLNFHPHPCACVSEPNCASLFAQKRALCPRVSHEKQPVLTIWIHHGAGSATRPPAVGCLATSMNLKLQQRARQRRQRQRQGEQRRRQQQQLRTDFARLPYEQPTSSELTTDFGDTYCTQT